MPRELEVWVSGFFKGTVTAKQLKYVAKDLYHRHVIDQMYAWNTFLLARYWEVQEYIAEHDLDRSKVNLLQLHQTI